MNDKNRDVFMQDAPSDVESRILEEMRLCAIESHDEAWAEGRFAGIDVEILAETAIATALSALQDEAGEQAASDMLDRMRDRLTAGEFDSTARHH
ncbi:hypothetical protein [Notoacmeibacter sp. MSK16QG-6]|uniref:hypothetical protein n=1 Tax=Notoacmeibacter sp. MSK16QG-6 TaxID=2957982 RepID=UPI00209F124D|nr:hypothetical protein [Notoacmeibacter sp. MSK16QG-6]MCP1198023.1 hypothetical protein [Notoacmeibacter sp. MSK16QG-6]